MFAQSADLATKIHWNQNEILHHMTQDFAWIKLILFSKRGLICVQLVVRDIHNWESFDDLLLILKLIRLSFIFNQDRNETAKNLSGNQNISKISENIHANTLPIKKITTWTHSENDRPRDDGTLRRMLLLVSASISASDISHQSS